MKTSKKLQRRIFIDTNVLIGYFRNQTADVNAMEYMFRLKDFELYTSALAISQTISTLQGKRKDSAYRQKITDYIIAMMNKINVIGLSAADIHKALSLHNVDIEDNIQFTTREKQRCYIYVTNNQKDFKYNNVLIVTPRYIRSIKAIMY